MSSSSTLGANGLKGDFMKIAAFGELQISVVPTSDNPEIFNVDVAAQNRREVMHMMTQKDETTDQFCIRLRSMLRSLMNAEPRVKLGEELKEKTNKPATWEQDKDRMQGKTDKTDSKTEKVEKTDKSADKSVDAKAAAK